MQRNSISNCIEWKRTVLLKEFFGYTNITSTSIYMIPEQLFSSFQLFQTLLYNIHICELSGRLINLHLSFHAKGLLLRNNTAVLSSIYSRAISRPAWTSENDVYPVFVRLPLQAL